MMRKTALILMLFLFSPDTFAAGRPDEVEEMGHLAGVVMACGAYRPLYQFEEIISRYFSNTSSDMEIEKMKLRQYAQAKAGTFSVYRNKKGECPETIRDFIQMPIFKSELYSDGSVRLPDGKFLYPRGQKKLAADAEKIYPVQRK